MGKKDLAPSTHPEKQKHEKVKKGEKKKGKGKAAAPAQSPLLAAETLALARPNQTDKVTLVTVRLPDGKELKVPKDTAAREVLVQSGLRSPYAVVAARFRNKIGSLDRPINVSGDLEPVHLGTRDGALIYRRSLTFVLIRAVAELFPDLRVYINHSVDQGYYSEFFNELMSGSNAIPISSRDVELIQKRMQEIVERDEPIERQEVTVAQARKLFKEAGMDDKVDLLRYSEDQAVSVYRLGACINHFYGQLAPSTGSLRHFELRHTPPGIVLRFPVRSRPDQVPAYRHQEKIFRALREQERWLRILEWRSVPELSTLIEAGGVREYVLIAEALHEKKVVELADQISAAKPRIVLLSGPSSSGKTTTIKRLAIQLRVNGWRPAVIGMDDFFVDRDKTPRDEQGGYDFESLHAIDIERLQDTIRRLMKGEDVVMPKFIFQKGHSIPGEHLRLEPGQLILMEGIHALNDQLLPNIPDGLKFKIYASSLTHLNVDNHNRISSSDVRLLRRVVRDFHTRGYDAVETLRRWPSVRRGEEINIFPYQENADFVFNSAPPYEISALKPFAKSVLERVKREEVEFSEAARLMKFLSYFRPIDPDFVPRHSLLREFIGGSCFIY